MVRMPQPKDSAADVFLDDKAVGARYSASRNSVWRWTRAGRLPQPIRLSPGATRWRLRDLIENEQRLSAGE